MTLPRTGDADGKRTLRLLLSLDDPASAMSCADVVVELTRDARVGEVGQALARYLTESVALDEPVPDDAVLACARLRSMTPEDCVNDTGLRSGDMVVLERDGDGWRERPDRSPEGSDGGAVSRSPAGGVVDLVINAGPQAGRRVMLSSGRHVLGRDPACDVVLDDPSLSRRHLRMDVDGEGVTVADLDSRNGSAIEERTLVGQVRVIPDDGAQIEVGRSVISFTTAPAPVPRVGSVRDGATQFNRRLRIPASHGAPRLELEAPPPQATRVRLQVGAAVLPLVLGGASAAIFAQPTLLLSMLLSPATLLWSYLSERRSGRRLFRQNEVRYRRRLEALGEELEQARVREREVRRAAAPDAAELIARAVELRPELWERRPANADFLALRLGVADLPAEYAVDTPAAEAELPAPARELLEAHRMVPLLPVVLDLTSVGGLGLVGPERGVDGLGAWLALQAAILHSPRELCIAAALDPDQRERWEWLKWLPHTRLHPSPIEGPQLVDDLAGTRDLLYRAAQLVAVRQHAASHPGHDGSARIPALVLFLDEDLVEERATVGAILERGPAVGVYTIWVGHLQRGLPGECRAVAQLDRELASLTLIYADGTGQLTDVSADGLSADLALYAARALASVRDLGAPDDRGHAEPSLDPSMRGRRHPAQLGRPPEGHGAMEGEGTVSVSPFTWAHAQPATVDSLARDATPGGDLQARAARA